MIGNNTINLNKVYNGNTAKYTAPVPKYTPKSLTDKDYKKHFKLAEQKIDAWLKVNKPNFKSISTIDGKKVEVVRYSYDQMISLDKEICGYLAESKKDIPERGIYYSKHTLNWLIHKLDPQNSTYFKTRLIDHSNVRIENGIEIGKKVQGLSVGASVWSNVFLESNQETTLEVMDGRSQTLNDNALSAKAIETTKSRVMVKAFSEATGLGYLLWLQPSYVINKMKEAEQEAIKAGHMTIETNEQVQPIAQQPIVEQPQAMSTNISPAGTQANIMPIEQPKKRTRRTKAQIEAEAAAKLAPQTFVNLQPNPTTEQTVPYNGNGIQPNNQQSNIPVINFNKPPQMDPVQQQPMIPVQPIAPPHNGQDLKAALLRLVQQDSSMAEKLITFLTSKNYSTMELSAVKDEDIITFLQQNGQNIG